jgi:hypothetical protein
MSISSLSPSLGSLPPRGTEHVGFVRKNRIQNQTIRIYNDIMHTRIMARNTNRMHFVGVVLAANRYALSRTGREQRNNAGASDTVRHARTAHGSFHVRQHRSGWKPSRSRPGPLRTTCDLRFARDRDGAPEVSCRRDLIPSANLGPIRMHTCHAYRSMGKYSGAAGGVQCCGV